MGLLDEIIGDKPKPNLLNVPSTWEREAVRKQASAPLPYGTGKNLLQISKEVGGSLGIDPNMLASSSLVEGVQQLFNPKAGAYSAAYETASQRGKINPRQYPVDAFYFAGLDNFGEKVDSLKKKGYLPKDMQYQVYPAWNETVEKNIANFDRNGNIVSYIMPKEIVDKAYFGQGKERMVAIEDIEKRLAQKGVQPVQTVAFKNTDDMIKAKAAYLRDLQDETLDYAKRRGVKPNQEQLNYLVMSAYNGGSGTMRKLVDRIKTGEDVVRKGGQNKMAHASASKRFSYMGHLSDLFNQGQTKP
jgi:hypothetical protein